MTKKIITISREFGSGGRFIGEEVAQKLGIAYYDKDIIGQIAQFLDLDLFQRFLRPQLHECLLDGTLRFFNANIQKTHLFCFFVDYPTIFLFCG